MVDKEVKYTPISVKEILKRMKNLSELMIDLSYCSLLYYDDKLIKKIYEMEEEMDNLEALLMMHAALATRNTKEAERIVSIYNLAISTDYISDAAGDIAKLSKEGARISAGRSLMASGSTNIVYYIEIKDGSRLIDKSLSQVYREIGEIFDVITVKSDGEYIFEPEPDYKIHAGDILFIKGLAENIDKLLEYSKEKEVEEITTYEEGILDNLLQLKNVSELMVDLAYSAIFTRSREIAEEIMAMEDYIDSLSEELKEDVLESTELSIREKIGMIGLADAYEEIADAAVNMIYSIIRGLKPHPIIDDVIDEAFERITLLEIGPDDHGKTIYDLGLVEKSVAVLAVRRGGKWLVTPPYSKFILNKNDVLLVRYYSEAEEDIEKIENEDVISEIRREEE
jgi:uncharacterized protein with PhoU and TrkA domain